MAAVHVRFSDRRELAGLDLVARSMGGVRATTEFRPCWGYVSLVERPHSATYIFPDEALKQAFARGREVE